MKIEFVSKGEVGELQEREGELILFSMEGMQEVSYEKELKGHTAFFEEAALLSKEEKGIVVGGCITHTRGHRRKSALVAENGKLCGVSDMIYATDGECNSGVALRVYDTKIGKMGVIVGGDLYFPEIVKNLVVCGSDFIVCPFGKVYNSVPSVLIRAYSYCYGVPILFCGEGYALFADGTGEIAFASPQSPAFRKFDKVKEYHLIEVRKRGKRLFS